MLYASSMARFDGIRRRRGLVLNCPWNSSALAAWARSLSLLNIRAAGVRPIVQLADFLRHDPGHTVSSSKHERRVVAHRVPSYVFAVIPAHTVSSSRHDLSSATARGVLTYLRRLCSAGSPL
ncbi:hypothetical protein PLICRDRAFT_313493 [Plicaturopsis crispa FD-325 SS-3]|nr:hypothetical protein PLICRDRAFT_313493 [Plicaturopsis crispa FD-325 SS-3]